MARPKAEETEEVEESTSNGSDRKKVDRISISIDPSLRRKMRIAAAFSDKEVGEWAQLVLARAADKALENVG